MDYNNINDLSSLVYLFVDGEAAETEKKVLFDALPDRPDLQEELEQAIRLNSGFVMDRNALIPASGSIESIFNRIDSETAPSTLASPGLSGQGAAHGFIKDNLLILQALTLAGLIVAALFFTKDINKTLVKNDSQANESGKNKFGSVSKDNVPVISSKDNAVNGNFLQKSTLLQGAKNEVSHGNNESGTVKTIFDQPESAFSQKTTSLIKAPVQFDLMPVKILTALNYSEIMQSPVETGGGGPGAYTPDFDLEINGRLGLGYFPGRTIQYNNQPYPDNVSIAVNYRINNYFSAGLSAGREQFPIFSVTERNDVLYFEKQESVAWYSAQATATVPIGGSLPGLNLTATPSFGFTKFGPIGKLKSGLRYDLGPTLSLQAGLEYSVLLYNYRSQLNAASKLGIVYGINIKF